MSDMGIMTFSSVHALTLTGDLKAYTLRGTKTGSKVNATEITGAIPAATGVILTGTPNKTYTLTITDAAATTRDINYSLRPVVIDYALEATYSIGSEDNKNWDNYIMVKDGECINSKPAAAVFSAKTERDVWEYENKNVSLRNNSEKSQHNEIQGRNQRELYDGRSHQGSTAMPALQGATV